MRATAINWLAGIAGEPNQAGATLRLSARPRRAAVVIAAILSHGDFAIFISRPISATCLVLALAALAAPLLPALARRRTALATSQS
jgi:hypothetical protein